MIRQRISFILLFSRLVIDENMKSLDGIRNIKGVADLGSLVLFMNNRLAYLKRPLDAIAKMQAARII